MASNQTTNLKLHKWAAGDRVRREEFNQNSDKIDSAFKTLESTVAANLATAGNCKIATGSWVGNGSSSGQNITLPISPKFLVAFGYLTNGNSHSKMAMIISPASNYWFYSGGGGSEPKLTLNGNILKLPDECTLNGANITQTYVAFT